MTGVLQNVAGSASEQLRLPHVPVVASMLTQFLVASDTGKPGCQNVTGLAAPLVHRKGAAALLAVWLMPIHVSFRPNTSTSHKCSAALCTSTTRERPGKKALHLVLASNHVIVLRTCT